MELIEILKKIGILYLMFIVCYWIYIMVRIIINRGMTSNQTPPKDTPKVQEMYCGCGKWFFRLFGLVYHKWQQWRIYATRWKRWNQRFCDHQHLVQKRAAAWFCGTMSLYMGSSTTKIAITTLLSDYKFLNIFYFIINETHCHHSLAHCQLCSFFVAPPEIP